MLSLLCESFDATSDSIFDKMLVHRCCTCMVSLQYGFGCVLLSVEPIGIVCDNSDNRMVAHQYESFDVDEDFQAK